MDGWIDGLMDGWIDGWEWLWKNSRFREWRYLALFTVTYRYALHDGRD